MDRARTYFGGEDELHLLLFSKVRSLLQRGEEAGEVASWVPEAARALEVEKSTLSASAEFVSRPISALDNWVSA